MKILISALFSIMALPAMASITSLKCTTIGHEAAVRIQFERSVDPQNPWIGWNQIQASLEVQPERSHQIYKTAIVLSPLTNGNHGDMRGDATQGGVYLQLFPQANGTYTGQLFINDLDARVYFDFRSEGNEAGLKCK
ncbi:MAG: hypothetical protein J7501_07750 [Bdellovibrio sp.]|nr:hypothetical protein [Bdellovibrio sp.]